MRTCRKPMCKVLRVVDIMLSVCRPALRARFVRHFASVSAADVKILRDRTGAPMLDCKEALKACDGDTSKSIDWLRQKGISKAASKSSRAASRGLVTVFVDGNRGSMIELNSETDFVAMNASFHKLAGSIASHWANISAHGATTIEDLNNSTLHFTDVNGSSMTGTTSEVVQQMVGVIGENLVLRRCGSLYVPEGLVLPYVHNSMAPGMGTIGVLLGVSNLHKMNRDEHSATFQALEGIAMHIAATSPLALDPSSLPRDFVEKEQAVMAEKFKASGKSDDLIQKMLAGSLKKLEAESCLLLQDYVLDDSPKPRTISTIVKSLASDSKQALAISGYSMFKLGH